MRNTANFIRKMWSFGSHAVRRIYVLGARFFSSSHRSLEKSAGFTLTELLIVIAITAIISAVGFVGLGNYRGRQAVSSAVDEVSSVIRTTRQRSLAQEGGGRWGIHFSNSSTSVSSYTTFRGYAYATGTIDRQYSLPSNVSFSNPFVSSTYDLVFSPLTGSVPERKVFSVVSGRGSAPVGDLVVKSNGSAVSRLESGLVGYWHLDEGTATTTYDASGKSNIGTLTNGPTWQSGSSCRAGGCVSFSAASSNYVQVQDSSDFVLGTGDATVAVWFKTSAATGALVTKRTGTGFQMYVLNGKFYADGAGTAGVSSVGNVNDGAWRQGVAVYDRAGGLLRLYVDGQPDQTTALGSTTLTDGATLEFGRKLLGGAGDYLTGSLDEVRIYNRALSATEIQAMYNDLK